MITIIAKFDVLSGKSDEFIKNATDLIRETRKEKGCLSYKMLQAENCTENFTFVEEWLNDTAIEQHNSAPHFVKFLDLTKPILKGDVKIDRFVKIPSVFY